MARRRSAVVYACACVRACVWDEPPPRTPAKVKAGDQGRLTTLRNTLTPTSNDHSSTTASSLQYIMLVASSNQVLPNALIRQLPVQEFRLFCCCEFASHSLLELRLQLFFSVRMVYTWSEKPRLIIFTRFQWSNRTTLAWLFFYLCCLCLLLYQYLAYVDIICYLCIQIRIKNLKL